MSATPTHLFQPFDVSVVPDRDRVILVPDGELDVSTVDRLDEESRRLRDAGFDRLVIDLRQVTFIDSCGLRLLLALRNDAARDGHSLSLVAGRPSVQRIFHVTMTHGLFDWDGHRPERRGDGSSAAA